MPSVAAPTLDEVYRWHSCGSRRRPYVWVAPKKAGGMFHCQGCHKAGRCVACADEQQRPLTAGTIPLLCRLHAGLLPDEPDVAIEVGLAWSSWKVFPLTYAPPPFTGSVAVPGVPSVPVPSQMSLFPSSP